MVIWLLKLYLTAVSIGTSGSLKVTSFVCVCLSVSMWGLQMMALFDALIVQKVLFGTVQFDESKPGHVAGHHAIATGGTGSIR